MPHAEDVGIYIPGSIQDPDRKPYTPPAVIHEIELETRAGSVPIPPKEGELDTLFDF